MQTAVLVLLAACSSSTWADEAVYYKEVVIQNTAELKDWCKQESERFYVAQDLTPYNWTASWWTKGNFLHVKGTWHVNEEVAVIRCSVRRGASERYATWQIVQE